MRQAWQVPGQAAGRVQAEPQQGQAELVQVQAAGRVQAEPQQGQAGQKQAGPPLPGPPDVRSGSSDA